MRKEEQVYYEDEKSSFKMDYIMEKSRYTKYRLNIGREVHICSRMSQHWRYMMARKMQK